jgi:acetyl-CoA synthetase
VMSGGEPTGEELVNRCREGLAAELVGVYGQTEADVLAGHRPGRWPVPPGAMGRPYPGHRLEVMAPDGGPAPPGTAGELVLRLPDAAAMLGYWGRPEATAERMREGRLWTADEVVADGDGNLWFKQRIDDVIKSGGYRVGPGEIEECLLRHPAVTGAAVIGVPDPVRGQSLKALVVPGPGVEATEELSEALREHVRASLAGYQVPRLIAFLAELPMTTTGKVDRAELRRREAGPAG